MRSILFPMIVAALLGGCGARADSDPGAGGLTVGEADTLERAAERLDERPQTPGAEDSRAFEADVAARIADEQRQKGQN